ncbi:unnamed protein product [Moneuplotes crassus]|uniref:Uncharacterized protein n=1 Tax=Euplotes crassus TaxID=5936 RepID=A0AAD1Y0V1_EUPCR|nr:unnamed protein product [Moneuplotes crassus]
MEDEETKQELEDGEKEENPSPELVKAPSGIPGLGADQDEEGNKIENQEIRFIFNPNRDKFPEKPYYEDGNPELYTDEKLAKRKALKEDVDVQNVIREFMTISFSFNPHKIIRRDEYFQKFIKIGQILRPNTEAEELQNLVKKDYENDNEGKTEDTIDEDKLYDSLFELADLWCPNIDAKEYVDFFNALKFKFRYDGQNNSSAYGPMHT